MAQSYNLYVANGTHQIQEFHYRLPGTHQARRQPIAVGGQIKVSGELSKKDVDAIIAQYEQYGMISADEIDNGMRPAPFAYRIDKPVTSEEMVQLVNRNQGIMVIRGRKAREDAAVVTATALGASAREKGIGMELGDVEITAIEEPGKGAQGDGEKVEERVIVEREDQATHGQGGRRSRRRR